MKRFIQRYLIWRKLRKAREACRRADFVTAAVHAGQPASAGIERSKSLFFASREF